jgi:uncharacterized protein
MRFDFDWDYRKAKTNVRKHSISFERATTIFRDPNLLSIPDEEHSEFEERWLTIGLDENGVLIVISHIFKYVSQERCRIRVISARKATKTEIKHYEEGI